MTESEDFPMKPTSQEVGVSIAPLKIAPAILDAQYYKVESAFPLAVIL